MRSKMPRADHLAVLVRVRESASVWEGDCSQGAAWVRVIHKVT